jgi:hypothetical protein
LKKPEKDLNSVLNTRRDLDLPPPLQNLLPKNLKLAYPLPLLFPLFEIRFNELERLHRILLIQI